MKTMKDRYEEFATMCVPKDTPEHYKTLVEHAFYAGALELINGVASIKKSSESKDIQQHQLKELYQEVIMFGLDFITRKLADALHQQSGDDNVQP